MIHHRQRLTLRLEAIDHRSSVHTKLDDLQRDFALERGALLSEIDDPAAAFAEFLHEPKIANEIASAFRWTCFGSFSHELCGGRERVQETANLHMLLSIIAAGSLQEAIPFRCRQQERGGEQFFCGCYGHRPAMRRRAAP